MDRACACIDSAALLSAAEQYRDSLGDKLEDMALILEAYEAVVANGHADPADRLSVLAKQIPESSISRENHIYVDGFIDFTRQEMQVLEAYYPPVKLSDMKWLSYTVLVKTDGVTPALAKKCEEALLSERVEVIKKAKSGDMVTLDIRPLIKSVSCALDGEMLRLSCVLSADQSRFLNPELVVKALRKYCGILSNPDLTKEYYTIMRERAYTKNMEIFR